MAKTPKSRTAASATTTPPGVISLKVTLNDIKPPIWRRILLSEGTTLGDLHRVIQAVMGWDDTHLHVFRISDRRFGDPGMVDDVLDEQRLTLYQVVSSGVTRFRYSYDFGDDWEHDILIEKAPPANTAITVPACIGGKRRCPPEDCGGPWGYADLLDILADPDHPQFAEQKDWLGEDFNPEAFSVADANAMLSAAFGHSEQSAPRSSDSTAAS